MKTIVVATDFSAAATNATDYAACLADQLGAGLLLVNAYAMPLSGFDSMPSLDLLGKMGDVSIESLEESRKRISKSWPRLKVECVSKMGTALNTVEEAARAHSAGLIVMGIETGADKVKEKIIGSTAVDAARNLKASLLIVPDGAKYRPVKKIAFAWDMHGGSDKSVMYKARYFCNTLSAELEIVNIENTESEANIPRAVKTEFLEENFANLKHRTRVIDDADVITALEEYFKIFPADMVMINPVKHGLLGALFHKSVTKELAFHAHTPLLVIH